MPVARSAHIRLQEKVTSFAGLHRIVSLAKRRGMRGSSASATERRPCWRRGPRRGVAVRVVVARSGGARGPLGLHLWCRSSRAGKSLASGEMTDLRDGAIPSFFFPPLTRLALAAELNGLIRGADDDNDASITRGIVGMLPRCGRWDGSCWSLGCAVVLVVPHPGGGGTGQGCGCVRLASQM